MMREARAARRTLAQEQNLRLAVALVAGTAPAQPAVASAPPPSAEPHAVPPPVQATAAASPPAPVPPADAPLRPAVIQAALPQVQAASAPPPSPEAIEQAEAFAQEDMVAAAQIRHDRGVTSRAKAYFRHLTLPADPAVIDALVRGTSGRLTLLDDIGGEQLDAAA